MDLQFLLSTQKNLQEHSGKYRECVSKHCNDQYKQIMQINMGTALALKSELDKETKSAKQKTIILRYIKKFKKMIHESLYQGYMQCVFINCSSEYLTFEQFIKSIMVPLKTQLTKLTNKMHKILLTYALQLVNDIFKENTKIKNKMKK
jgi:hypothetical protein